MNKGQSFQMWFEYKARTKIRTEIVVCVHVGGGGGAGTNISERVKGKVAKWLPLLKHQRIYFTYFPMCPHFFSHGQ